MTHPEQGTLRALLDQELTEGEARAVREHVAGCVACDVALRRAEENQVLATALLDSIDVSPPTEIVRARLAEQRAAAAARSARRPWLGGRDLAKAAILVLAFSGVVAAAVHPASPLRRMLGREAPALRVQPAPPEETGALSRAREVGVRLSGVGADSRVELTQAVEDTRIEVTWVEGGGAAVYAPEGTQFTTSDGEGRIDATLAPGPVRVELPRSAAAASLRVNGRVYLEKAGERIDFPGPPALVDGPRVRFEVR